MSRSPITSHVLDATLGRPGRDIALRLEYLPARSDVKVLAAGCVAAPLCRLTAQDDR